jgi:ankyrin repeat protein
VAGGTTALMNACKYGRPKCARALLDANDIIVDAADSEGYTALYYAAMNGHPYIHIISLLIEHKAHVNMTNRHGKTPLMIASECGWIDCVRLLLTVNGINVDAMDDDGDTALMCAVLGGHVNVVSLLIAQDVNVNATAKLGPSAQKSKACLVLFLTLPVGHRFPFSMVTMKK